MENITLSTNSWDSETFIYLTREYKNNICLNENEIGIGKADDPLRRWKEHNAASSKSTVKIAFEYIYLVKTKEYEKQLHKWLVSKGFDNVEKEVFSGADKNGQVLTIDFIKSVIEKEALDGPWAIVDGKILQTQHYQELKKKKEIDSLHNLFINSKQYNPGLINQLKIALDKKIIEYNNLAQQYKNDVKIACHCIEKDLLIRNHIPEYIKFDINVLLALYNKNIINFSYIEINIHLVFDSTNKLTQEQIPEYISQQKTNIENAKNIKEKFKLFEQKRIEKERAIYETKNAIRTNKITFLPYEKLFIDNPQLIDFALINKYISIYNIDARLLKHYLPYNKINIDPYLEHILQSDEYISNNLISSKLIKRAERKNGFINLLMALNIVSLFVGPGITITIQNNYINSLPLEIIWAQILFHIILIFFIKPNNEIKYFLMLQNGHIGRSFNNNNDNKANFFESRIQDSLKGKWDISNSDF